MLPILLRIGEHGDVGGSGGLLLYNIVTLDPCKVPKGGGECLESCQWQLPAIIVSQSFALATQKE